MSHSYLIWNPRQVSLLPRDPCDWLPENHIASILLDVVEVMDLSAFGKKGVDARGAAGFHPTMMVVLVLYCLLSKQTSARSMERFIQCDLGGRFLCGGDTVPGWRCIAAFRQKFRKELGDLFAKSVQCCMDAKLVDSSVIFADGTKIEALASKQSNITYGRVDNAMEKLQQKFDALLAEADRLDAEEDKFEEAEKVRDDAEKLKNRKQLLLDAKNRMEEKARLDKEKWDETPKEKRPHDTKPTGEPKKDDRSNLVDPDSRLMKMKDGSFSQGYNVQLGVEEKNQIILGMAISNDPTDPKQLAPTVENVEEIIGCKPETWVADAGYLSEENIKYLEGKKIDPIICPDRKIATDEEKTAEDQNVSEAETKHENEDGSKSKKPRNPSWAQTQMRAKLATDKGKSTYAKRCQVVEPVFGQMKGSPGNPGTTRFTVTGLTNCQYVMLLECAVHNLGKLIRSKIRSRCQNQKASLPIFMRNLPVMKLRQQTLSMAI